MDERQNMTSAPFFHDEDSPSPPDESNLVIDLQSESETDEEHTEASQQTHIFHLKNTLAFDAENKASSSTANGCNQTLAESSPSDNEVSPSSDSCSAAEEANFETENSSLQSENLVPVARVEPLSSTTTEQTIQEVKQTQQGSLGPAQNAPMTSPGQNMQSTWSQQGPDTIPKYSMSQQDEMEVAIRKAKNFQRANQDPWILEPRNGSSNSQTMQQATQAQQATTSQLDNSPHSAHIATNKMYNNRETNYQPMQQVTQMPLDLMSRQPTINIMTPFKWPERKLMRYSLKPKDSNSSQQAMQQQNLIRYPLRTNESNISQQAKPLQRENNASTNYQSTSMNPQAMPQPIQQLARLQQMDAQMAWPRASSVPTNSQAMLRNPYQVPQMPTYTRPTLPMQHQASQQRLLYPMPYVQQRHAQQAAPASLPPTMRPQMPPIMGHAQGIQQRANLPTSYYETLQGRQNAQHVTETFKTPRNNMPTGSLNLRKQEGQQSGQSNAVATSKQKRAGTESNSDAFAIPVEIPPEITVTRAVKRPNAEELGNGSENKKSKSDSYPISLKDMKMLERNNVSLFLAEKDSNKR